MKIIKKLLSLILLLAVVLSVIPKLTVSAGYDTFASYVAKYRQFFSDRRWQPGTPWGDNRTPYHGFYKALGCASLCSDFEYYMYGTYGWKGTKYTKVSAITSGDIVKLSDPHWFIVLERRGDVLLVAEKHKDQVYISDTHYRMHNGVLQKFGYYNSSGKWVNGWKKCSFSKGYHYIDIEAQDITVTWDASPAMLEITEDDAAFAVRGCLTGAAEKDITKCGFNLYNANDELLESFEEEPAFTGAEQYISLQYGVQSSLGMKLVPGCDYRYELFVTIAGVEYYSPQVGFTTDEYIAELKDHTVPAYLAGDMDRNSTVDSDDAIYLLRHTLFADSYPVTQQVDYNGDGEITSDDAIYLLRHTLFPNEYVLKQ